MKAQRRGVILLNASKGAFAPTVDNAAYASSKAAVAALCRNLAAELGPHGIRVNAFNADFVDTPLMRTPDRAARGPQGHHRRGAGRGVPPPQPAAGRPHPARGRGRGGPVPGLAARRATPPAPPSRSTAASRRRCPGSGLAPAYLIALVEQHPQPQLAGRGESSRPSLFRSTTLYWRPRAMFSPWAAMVWRVNFSAAWSQL